jgi:hypothetical protein
MSMVGYIYPTILGIMVVAPTVNIPSHPMPRDPGLEELIKSSLANTRDLTEKAMFGGWAWLLHGNLLCGARRGSLLLRVGKDSETWANEIPGVATAIMHGRRMSGWVRATPEAYGNDALRQKLIDAALNFTGSLPKKKKQ